MLPPSTTADAHRAALRRPAGEEAFYRPPYHHLRHPMVFYYRHPAALYINSCGWRASSTTRSTPISNGSSVIGVDEMRWDDMSKNEMEWPDFAEAHTYRARVCYITVRHLIETHPHPPGGTRPDHHGPPPVGTLHGLRARVHPPGDVLGIDPRTAGRPGAPPGRLAGRDASAEADAHSRPAGAGLLGGPPGWRCWPAGSAWAKLATGPASAGTQRIRPARSGRQASR